MAQARRIVRHFILALLLLLHACLSTREQKQREFQQAPLFGMVYDYDQKPCPGAAILVDGQPRGQTDINGRFVVNDLARGEHRIGVRKPGFEEQDADFEFLNREQILYLRVVSLRQLLDQAEAALEAKRHAEAASLLARAEHIAVGDPVAAYLKALYLVEMGAAAEAAEVLEGLLQIGHREAVLYLSLADIYQYRLGDPARAADRLQAYVELQNDPEVRARLETIQPGNP